MPKSLAHGGAEIQQENDPASYTVEEIQGGFLPISTMQLCLAWWLYQQKHITLRQLRVYFALQEMKERRKHTKAKDGRGRPRTPSYSAEELSKLVGGQGSDTALAALRTDLSKLHKIGLASVKQTSISFATSPDQINVDDLAGFWNFWEQVPNRRRTVPVPRRTLRAMAGGFKMATMGVLIALLIRSIHWHKREGHIRVDGRTKASWIAKVFGLSPRAVKNGRNQLRSLGWCQQLPVTQIMLNRYGSRDLINVHWKPSDATPEPANNSDKHAQPLHENTTRFAYPNKNRNPLSTKEYIKNRTSNNTTASAENVGASREKDGGLATSTTNNEKPLGKPKLTALDPRHLADTKSLLELYQQAIDAKLVEDSEHDRLRFIALAERARSRGREPQKLFRWLLTHRRFEYTSQADEDAANCRLKDYLFERDNPLYQRQPNSHKGMDREQGIVQREKVPFTETDSTLLAIYQVARKVKLPPDRVAKHKGWTRQQFDLAVEQYELRHGALN